MFMHFEQKGEENPWSNETGPNCRTMLSFWEKKNYFKHVLNEEMFSQKIGFCINGHDQIRSRNHKDRREHHFEVLHSSLYSELIPKSTVQDELFEVPQLLLLCITVISYVCPQNNGNPPIINYFIANTVREARKPGKQNATAKNHPSSMCCYEVSI